MNRVWSHTVVVIGCILTLRGAAHGGPPNNDVSDAFHNTAGGTNALVNNTPSVGDGGAFNTAFGDNALGSNTTGGFNTASGFHTLFSNTEGIENTASGFAALASNTTGAYNTASGVDALLSNTTGYENTASGVDALYSNTTGGGNTASGSFALASNTTGNGNTALGWEALGGAEGTGNTAIGWEAGANLMSGDQNIYLGHPGVNSESNTLRLGSDNQTRAFIAGVTSTPMLGNTVLINSDGQLGTLVSSARYKQDIQPLEEQGEKLQQLRAVTFHYKQVPQGPVQYGLIAEEVAQAYPELVTRNAKGEVEGVRYDELAPLLLGEVQRQQHQLVAIKAQNEQVQARQQQEIVALKAALVQQNEAVAARLAQLEEAAARSATLARR